MLRIYHNLCVKTVNNYDMKVLVAGVTGLVGRVMLKVLAERKFPADEVIAAASERSEGKELEYGEKKIKVQSLHAALQEEPDIALFSAGKDISLEWAPLFAQAGTYVIDNSSAWRMHPGYKLIVPEINADILVKEDHIIANPNCSTIQMVLALAPLHFSYKIVRIVVSTYQSVTGSGLSGVIQLENERKQKSRKTVYQHPIDLNCFPHGGEFMENGYTTEEIKLVDETRKLLNDQDIGVSATVVRVPLKGGHSEAVNIEFAQDFEMSEVREWLEDMPGVALMDDPQKSKYPTALNAEGKDQVFVGRIRRDFSKSNALNMWVVSDNLRKGAATNAVQIAEYIIRQNWV